MTGCVFSTTCNADEVHILYMMLTVCYNKGQRIRKRQSKIDNPTQSRDTSNVQYTRRILYCIPFVCLIVFTTCADIPGNQTTQNGCFLFFGSLKHPKVRTSKKRIILWEHRVLLLHALYPDENAQKNHII